MDGGKSFAAVLVVGTGCIGITVDEVANVAFVDGDRAVLDPFDPARATNRNAGAISRRGDAAHSPRCGSHPSEAHPFWFSESALRPFRSRRDNFC